MRCIKASIIALVRFARREFCISRLLLKLPLQKASNSMRICISRFRLSVELRSIPLNYSIVLRTLRSRPSPSIRRLVRLSISTSHLVSVLCQFLLHDYTLSYNCLFKHFFYLERESSAAFRSSHIAALQHESKQLSSFKENLAQKIDSTATSVTKMAAASSKEVLCYHRGLLLVITHH